MKIYNWTLTAATHNIMVLENVNPNIYEVVEDRITTADEEDDNLVDDFDAREIFGMIKD